MVGFFSHIADELIVFLVGDFYLGEGILAQAGVLAMPVFNSFTVTVTARADEKMKRDEHRLQLYDIFVFLLRFFGAVHIQLFEFARQGIASPPEKIGGVAFAPGGVFQSGFDQCPFKRRHRFAQ